MEKPPNGAAKVCNHAGAYFNGGTGFRAGWTPCRRIRHYRKTASGNSGVAINTELPGNAIIVVTLPFVGGASYGRAICPYRAAGTAAPRIRLQCNRVIPQGYQALRVEAEFYHEDGLVGIPAFRGANGAYYTDYGGQAGALVVNRLIAVEH